MLTVLCGDAGTVWISIIEGRNMAARDLGNTSDPYVTLSIDGALSPYMQLDPRIGV